MSIRDLKTATDHTDKGLHDLYLKIKPQSFLPGGNDVIFILFL